MRVCIDFAEKYIIIYTFIKQR